jgi:hypothetical protein
MLRIARNGQITDGIGKDAAIGPREEKKMTRKAEYQRYLQSPEWRDHRDQALARTSGFCQFCGFFAAHVHHVRYPKQFGDEHPNSLVPVCDPCHKTAHGIQKMKTISNAKETSEITPIGSRLNYLLDGPRVYASARSWAKALQVPTVMFLWFEKFLGITAKMRQSIGSELEVTYKDVAVYRWHAVAETLRGFDHQYVAGKFGNKVQPTEKQAYDQFHADYSKLVQWGYDLQERALASAMNANKPVVKAPVTEEQLVAVVKQAVAPRLYAHDEKLREHDIKITEIQEAVPTLKDPREFIPVKQGVAEKGLDATLMPLHPESNETLSGLAGQMLTTKGAEKGASVISRLDGQARGVAMNTYHRGEIYAVLDEIMRRKPEGLRF